MSSTFYYTYSFEHTSTFDLPSLAQTMMSVELGFSYERTKKTMFHLDCTQTPHKHSTFESDWGELNICCPADGLTHIPILESYLPKPFTRKVVDDLFDDETTDMVE